MRGSEILLERIAALAEVFVFDMWICRLVVQMVGHLLFYRNSVFFFLFFHGFNSDVKRIHRCCMSTRDLM